MCIRDSFLGLPILRCSIELYCHTSSCNLQSNILFRWAIHLCLFSTVWSLRSSNVQLFTNVFNEQSIPSCTAFNRISFPMTVFYWDVLFHEAKFQNHNAGASITLKYFSRVSFLVFVTVVDVLCLTLTKFIQLMIHIVIHIISDITTKIEEMWHMLCILIIQ